LHFPPSSLSDIFYALQNTTFEQVRHIPYAFMSMQKWVKKFGLDKNAKFVRFLNEQLLITAQNTAEQVNVLFGATALCYTNYGNYYIDGGLINLVNPFIEFIEKKGGKLLLRHEVSKISQKNKGYLVKCSHKSEKNLFFESDFLISGIPINNTLSLFSSDKLDKKYKNKILDSEKLNSAFQMGIAFLPHQHYDCIHHQIHIDLPFIGSKSVFLSLSHPADSSRSDDSGYAVASISTHIADPKNTQFEKEELEKIIIEKLHQLQLIRKENIVYSHSSAAQSWQKWTKRIFGSVGGYPQYLKIKPWQLIDARLDHQKAYICGDTTYPGQGIAGVVLSGIIAYEKLKADHF